MKNIIYIVSLSIICLKSYSQNTNDDLKEHQPIQVLNFGTFHMGFTNDETKIEFDENDKSKQVQAKKIAKQLAEFGPTVVIVEKRPESNSKLQEIYKKYTQDPDIKFKNPSEVELIAFEVGRLSGAERIYGIDHKMGYNYKIGNEIENSIDSIWFNKYAQNPLKFHPDIDNKKDSKELIGQLKQMNNNQFLDFLIAVNADMLTHTGTKNGFEGADEAAKYYKRNLRMFSNLNRLELTHEDKVFILMGASHTAFFRDFMSRNPKYEMVDTLKYLD